MRNEGQQSQPRKSRPIAEKVRVLRQERRWTQAELARHLELSQSRLSEIETGDGSFTAEQFLTILRLFNVPASHFTESAPDHQAALQNALARLGAVQLRESSEIVPPDDLVALPDVIRETLLDGSARLITALAPVLESHIDRLNLNRLHAVTVEVGLAGRLGWVLENTLAALGQELAGALPSPWAQRYRRAQTLLGAFLESAAAPQAARSQTAVAADILDPGIRSKRTLEEVRASSSDISRRWHVVTRLQPENFAEALRGARAGD
jgi:transcriptional regulator with XRE-family HTH domain